MDLKVLEAVNEYRDQLRKTKAQFLRVLITTHNGMFLLIASEYVTAHHRLQLHPCSFFLDELVDVSDTEFTPVHSNT